MYVCMYVCMSACMYVCLPACMSACVCMYVCMYVYIYYINQDIHMSSCSLHSMCGCSRHRRNQPCQLSLNRQSRHSPLALSPPYLPSPPSLPSLRVKNIPVKNPRTDLSRTITKMITVPRVCLKKRLRHLRPTPHLLRN